MKMRVHKVRKVRCRRQGWVDSGLYARFIRHADLYLQEVRTQRLAYMLRSE